MINREHAPSKFQEQQVRYWHEERHRKRKDPRHPVIAAYTKPKIDFILPHILLPEHATILDVGAGNGYFSYHWDTIGDVTAIDYSPVVLEGNPVQNTAVMDARSLTYKENTFDLVFCHALLHHIEKKDRVQVVREMARVSKQYVAYIEPNILNPVIAGFSVLKKEEHGALCFTPAYVRSLAEHAGLRVIMSTSWGFLTPNRMPFSKVLLPLFAKCERPLPFGVTTIVIAEKY